MTCPYPLFFSEFQLECRQLPLFVLQSPLCSLARYVNVTPLIFRSITHCMVRNFLSSFFVILQISLHKSLLCTSPAVTAPFLVYVTAGRKCFTSTHFVWFTAKHFHPAVKLRNLSRELLGLGYRKAFIKHVDLGYTLTLYMLLHKKLRVEQVGTVIMMASQNKYASMQHVSSRVDETYSLVYYLKHKAAQAPHVRDFKRHVCDWHLNFHMI